MQELTREISVAYNVCEHNNNSNKIDIIHTTGEVVPKSSNHKLENLAASLLVPTSGIKLENVQPPELIPVWQSTGERAHLRGSSNVTKLLLQSSDDPLISHGANNDGHDEDHPFKTLLARKTQDQRTAHNGGCSTLTRQQLKVKANLMSARKSYRQPQGQVHSQILVEQASSTPRQAKPKRRQSITNMPKLRFHHQALPAEYAAHYEATQGRHAPKAKPSQAASAASNAAPPTKQAHENVRSWLRKIAEIQLSAERQQQTHDTRSPSLVVSSSVPAVVAPTSTQHANKRTVLKYADLPYMGEITLDNYKPRRGRKPKKADICHLIYKNYGTIVPAAVLPTSVSAELTQRVVHKNVQVVTDEPLNLCLRDQSNDRYSISSSDSESDKPSTMTIATTTTDCGSSSNRATPLTESHKVDSLSKSLTPELIKEQHAVTSNFLLQPVGLYYQQLMESCAFGGRPVETIEKDNQLALKIPIPNGFFSSIAKRESLIQPNEASSMPLAIRKRKRSAIFIPPKASEHSSSPSTEVSICKFKFTGGAKPMLQEKKMLSVDSEGNYRYYNGTGERTMRGHEFIQREQLQQSLPQNPQIPNGRSEKLYIDIPPPSTDLSLELLHMPPESPTSSLLMSSNLVPAAPQSPASQYSSSQSPMPVHAEPSHKGNAELLTDNARKRRCSRRSKHREKMEKTFKEKGFLIQTQQLESAEGATYCKFRQLKKFTRYLFRNWKDHIPESDLTTHQSNGNSGCDQHSVFENLLSDQIGLESVTSAKTTDQSQLK